MTTPDDAVHDSTKPPLVDSGYPIRPPFFAHRFTRLVFKSCAAQDIGHHAVLLIIHIAHTEDAARYRGPVRFWNSQLVETLGLPSERALRAAKQRAMEYGVLHCERDSNRQVGRYWVKIRPDWDAFDDSPIEPNRFANGGAIQGANTGANDLNNSGFVTGITPDSCTEKRRNHALTSIPVNPSPEILSLDTNATRKTKTRAPRKSGRSPPAVADLPSFDEVERYWTERFAPIDEMTALQRRKLQTRWKDEAFRTRWREFIDCISRSAYCRGDNAHGWIADIDFFLKPDKFTKFLNGDYTNDQYPKRTPQLSAAVRREQANADSFAILEAAAAAACSSQER